MALTRLPSAYDAEAGGIPIKSIAYIGMWEVYNGHSTWYWDDGTYDVAGPSGRPGLVHDAWAPNNPHVEDDKRVFGIAGINSQDSKVYMMDYYGGWANYQIACLCQLPVPDNGNTEWPLSAGMFPSSERVPGGLPTFEPSITVSDDTTTYSFISQEQDSTRVSLVTSGDKAMTALEAARLCADTIPGSRLFRWDYRTQLEELNQAANAISYRYLSKAAPITIILLGMYQPTAGHDASLGWKQRTWFFMPDDVSGLDAAYVGRMDEGVQQYRVPAETLSNETPFVSFAPNDIDNSDIVASCVADRAQQHQAVSLAG